MYTDVHDPYVPVAQRKEYLRVLVKHQGLVHEGRLLNAFAGPLLLRSLDGETAANVFSGRHLPLYHLGLTAGFGSTSVVGSMIDRARTASPES